MKRLHAPLRGTAVVMSASLLLTGVTTYGAPKKAEPAPAVQPVPAPEPAPQKKGFFAKTKEALGLKKKEQPAVTPENVAPPVPAPAGKKGQAKKAAPARAETAQAAPKAKAETKPAAKKTAAPAEAPKVVKQSKPAVEPAQVEEQPKKGWLKGLFRGKSKEEAVPVEPQLAKAKTAKPAPVKEVKPVVAKPGEKAVALEDSPPKEKRGFLGFFRKLREPLNDGTDPSLVEAGKIERPTDWKEHKVVTDDGIAIYSFGPMQTNGPDRRLNRGTVVKVKSVKRGWALVEVDGGFAGYMDASMLRDAIAGDFSDPAPPVMMASAGMPDAWAPLAPPPDLPDQPGKMDSDPALLLLPPLELEPKPKPAPTEAKP